METGRIIDSFVPAASQRVRVYIWEVPVRVTHWVIVATIIVLTVTGAYIADPFLIPPGGSVMMSVRFVHMLAAFVFLAAGVAPDLLAVRRQPLRSLDGVHPDQPEPGS